MERIHIVVDIDIETENYLKVHSRSLTNRDTEDAVLYKDYYKNIENKELKVIFPILQARLNSLLSFLNDKNSPGRGGHYNADPSRDLIELIDTIRKLEAALKETPLSFEIDPTYQEVIELCKPMLSKYQGSPIPKDFPIIDIIEHKEVFLLSNVVKVKGSKEKSLPLKNVGEGSYANVFKYKDPQYNKWFVVKRAKKNLTKQELARFRNEYDETHSLNSLYVINTYNFDDEKKEYIMEYADGGSLADYISKNNNKITMKQRITLINQVFRAFSYIHQKGLLHRDISYQNILIKKYDDGIVIKVSDFGLVKSKDSTLTSLDSSIKGSLNDPDLVKVGFAKYEVRHEIYAIAQVINFILCGRKLANGIFDKSTDIRDFILNGLSSNIDERFTSVDEMAKEFASLQIQLLGK